MKVTVIQRSERLLPESDPEVGDTLAGVFRKQGSEVFCGTQIQRVVRKGKKKRIEFLQNGKKRSVEGRGLYCRERSKMARQNRYNAHIASTYN